MAPGWWQVGNPTTLLFNRQAYLAVLAGVCVASRRAAIAAGVATFPFHSLFCTINRVTNAVKTGFACYKKIDEKNNSLLTKLIILRACVFVDA